MADQHLRVPVEPVVILPLLEVNLGDGEWGYPGAEVCTGVRVSRLENWYKKQVEDAVRDGLIGYRDGALGTCALVLRGIDVSSWDHSGSGARRVALPALLAVRLSLQGRMVSPFAYASPTRLKSAGKDRYWYESYCAKIEVPPFVFSWPYIERMTISQANLPMIGRVYERCRGWDLDPGHEYCEIAAYWLSRAYCATSVVECFIHAFIGLETLFDDGHGHATACSRASVFVAKSEEGWRDTREKLRKAYNVRSRHIHGSHLDPEECRTHMELVINTLRAAVLRLAWQSLGIPRKCKLLCDLDNEAQTFERVQQRYPQAVLEPPA